MSDITEFTLAPAPTGLERLEQAIRRLEARHGFQRCRAAGDLPAAGPALLLLTGDPQRFPEVLDAAVILPEALQGQTPAPRCLVADPDASALMAPAWGAPRVPAVVFLRDGQYLGCLSGIRDWSEYQAEVRHLLHGPVQPRPISIPVIRQGACA
ncbi:hypothetical protein [Azovibrio restrictus]|uniref:hypothetical protein n=1 Tax=Azovibrio restrictus TaxID=146938 RepID=UPI0026ECD9D2|nr:hypothetical protein [Azovibrio restrictus]